MQRPGVDVIWEFQGFYVCPLTVPRQVFFVFQYGDDKTGTERQGSSGKGGRYSIFRTEKHFYYHRVSNDRSVLSQSLTILCSVGRGYKSFPGEVLPYKRLMGCAAG